MTNLLDVSLEINSKQATKIPGKASGVQLLSEMCVFFVLYDDLEPYFQEVEKTHRNNPNKDIMRYKGIEVKM